MKNSQAYLFDIKKSILKIQKYTADVNSFFEFIKDDKTLSAVERPLIIIKEAVVQFSKSDELKNAEKIKGFRNRLIHAYDNVDPEIIWSIVTRHLPQLLTEVDKKLNP